MDKPIFIVGMPRSGSTLWLNIVARNSNIFRIGEMLFLTPWRKDFKYFIKKYVGDLSIDRNISNMIEIMFSRKLTPGITASFWLNDLAKCDHPKIKENIYGRIQKSDRTIKSIFSILIEEIAYFKGFYRCCVKFPVYVNHIPDLLKWYPQCKIIHIIRDPRAVAISRTNDPEGTQIKIRKYPLLKFFIKKIMTCFVIIQYIWASKLHCKFRSIDNYALFKYEDLLMEPIKVVRELCEFAEIDFEHEMLHPKEGQASSVTGKRHSGFNKKAALNWRNNITPLDKLLVTLLTRGSMKRFEYDPNNHPIFSND